MIIKSDDIFNVELPKISPPNDNAIPSEKNFSIQLTLRVKEAFPIFETIGGNEVKTKQVDTISPLRIHVCRLTFNIDNSQTSIDLFNIKHRG
jgi:hypothetical protein